ncbi:MAG: D-ribose-binding periplasmic protein precursor [candidate division BRC1 bacterium ADurb.BinA364]|nr:MAG: D-ribose-binding periplasmic protein precursor [candidate division BRC1 bacterium ADurb.BinA364]
MRDATRRGIKVVIIDSDLNSEDHISFVATDNFKGGQLAARRLGEIMGGKGKAIMMRYSEGSASTHNREEGFLEVMAKEFPEIELLSTNQYGGVTSESAFQRGQNLLNQYGAQVDGIFCPNESSAFGMLRALQTSGKAGVVKFVGFDISPALYKGFQDGQINGLTVQNPFRMGYLGVQTAVQALEGQDVEKRIDTGAVMVTPENIDDPNVREAVDPQLKQ